MGRFESALKSKEEILKKIKEKKSLSIKQKKWQWRCYELIVKERGSIFLGVLLVLSLLGGVCATKSNSPKDDQNIDVYNTVWENEEFKITLNENSGSTGYKWYLNLPSGIELISDKYYPSNNKIGATGYRQYTFKALQIGNYELKFNLARSWDKETPIQTKTWHIQTNTWRNNKFKTIIKLVKITIEGFP